MAYKYLRSSMPITNITQMERYRNDFQDLLDKQFTNASDVYEIDEEYPLASGNYRKSTVRILTHVIANDTGNKLGEDYRRILFQDLSHATKIGTLYYFDSNYWIAINSDINKNLAATVLIKRCNNLLKWIDNNGNIHSVPCSIDYLLKENRDYSTAGSSLVNPAAQMEIIVQFNDETNLIKPNQRFLFGNASNWHAYKVLGGGVNNFNNMETSNNDTVGLLRISTGINYLNEDTDNLTLGIADYYTNVYTLSLSKSTLSGNPGGTYHLVSTVTYNGNTVTRNLVWSSDNEDVATVSTLGLVTFVSSGSCTITCEIDNNPSASDTCALTVTSVPVSEYEIRISPDVNYVLENQTQTFSAYLYKNNVSQADAVSFTLNPNSVPSDHYTFTPVDANHFSIENNEMFLSDFITVTMTSTVVKTLDVYLKGAW